MGMAPAWFVPGSARRSLLSAGQREGPRAPAQGRAGEDHLRVLSGAASMSPLRPRGARTLRVWGATTPREREPILGSLPIPGSGLRARPAPVAAGASVPISQIGTAHA